jgi:hypothetical protein
MRGSPQPPWFNQPLRVALRITSKADQQRIDRIDRLSRESTTSLLSRTATVLALFGALIGLMLLVD